MDTQLPVSPAVENSVKTEGNNVPIPDFHKFANIFHDRIHAVIFYLLEMEGKFTLITNLLDRSPYYADKEEEVLVYAGAETQRRILEKPSLHTLHTAEEWDEVWQVNRRKNRDENWSFLQDAQITREMINVETFKYLDQFVNHELDFSNINIGLLRDYFRELDNELKKNEKPILEDDFDLEQDLYLSIPVISFGKFEGVVHVIFEEKDRDKLDSLLAKKLLVRQVQLEYEGLILDWDSVGGNMREKSRVKYRHLEIDDPYVKRSPIMKQLHATKYYQSSDKYYKDRIEASNEISKAITNQQRQLAIITILLDSYSHNISAHSLTVLNWWFKELAEYLRALINGESYGGKDINPLINFYEQMKLPLAKELFPLFRFLMEKGAFWSGITRQTNFTGRIRSLFSVLWDDFFQNPLYLGTIANSEKINKVHIHVTVFENEVRRKGQDFVNRKYIKKIKGRRLDGRMVTINLVDFEKTEDPDTLSPFVEKSPLFDLFKEELSRYEAFFPSGVVGKHAFFTLIENEIRNVKHYHGDILEAIQQQGLVLNISIHERPFDSEKVIPGKPFEVYKIGIWLRHPVELDSTLAVARLQGLRADILTDTFRPQLGGNFQDKICASMLMNNTFADVQDDLSEKGRIYYPWIKTASAKLDEEGVDWIEDFEISVRKYENYSDQEFAALYSPGSGYLKKYFHLWKGAEVCDLDEIHYVEKENIARFRFVHAPVFNPVRYRELKAKGVMRIISGAERPADVVAAYSRWLQTWIKPKGDYVVDFYEEGDSVGRITFEDGVGRFFNVREIEDINLSDKAFKAYKKFPNRIAIDMNHGGAVSDDPTKCNYRTHGVLIRDFFQGERMSFVENMDPERIYELFETLTTKICIFDRRLYGRICKKQVYNQQESTQAEKEIIERQERKLAFYRNSLNIDFQDETEEAWTERRGKGFLDAYHFLIVHLSFIENMKDSNGNRYGEEGIQRFIGEQILQGVAPEDVPEGFILVITTGRGRMEWWTKLTESPFLRFTTFRPIESILAGVEDALIMPDDFGVKYNVTKELLGS